MHNCSPDFSRYDSLNWVCFLCRRLSTFKPLVISTYNVRTLHQQGKTHQLFMGCSDVGIDIIGIQEHRLITKEPTEELWSDDKN